MKIAIIGTALHCSKAPFGDPSWEIWGANAGQLPRWNRWFDLHDDASIDTYPGHREFLTADHGKPVYTRQTYPLAAMVEKYGTWFFTSTIAYEMALALEEDPDEIGLWGVDMAAAEEYGHQKAGCRFFIQTALMRGIQVTMPPEAEVGVPGQLYCFSPPSLLRVKAQARVAEIQGRIHLNAEHRSTLALQQALLRGRLEVTMPEDQAKAHLDQVALALAQAEKDALILDGGLQNAIHVLNNWCGD